MPDADPRLTLSQDDVEELRTHAQLINAEAKRVERNAKVVKRMSARILEQLTVPEEDTETDDRRT